ncbi:MULTISPECIES: DUF1934 family protein [Terrabacteria group]|uniref:DUF1934 family protein n=1 Tax=Bacillati TaxID=1783272 RepID=UPI00193A7168|nr:MULTISPECIES: DUF1934 family protein [Terrabacteria group]MBW9212924.1 DUF1934 domain-containing protein [Trueperella sp. zg.1013]QRG86984.1 DUF1934 family protein [Bulleidia sp. zg-1006]
MKATIKLCTKENLISDGIGFYSEGKLRYFELDKKTKQEVNFKDDTIEIIRKAEVETHLILRRSGDSSCEVNSEYGVMKIPVRLLRYEKKNGEIYLSYEMNENEIHHFHWKVEPLV